MVVLPLLPKRRKPQTRLLRHRRQPNKRIAHRNRLDERLNVPPVRCHDPLPLAGALDEARAIGDLDAWVRGPQPKRQELQLGVVVGVCEDPVAPPHASWSVGEAVDAELVGTVETGAFAGGGLEGGAASDRSAWGTWGTGLAGLGGAPLDVALVGGGVIFGFGGRGVL